MSKNENLKNIEQFFDDLKMDEPVSNEQLREATESAIKDRAKLFYFVWKTIQEMHPDIDADAIMKEASIKFGYSRAGNFNATNHCDEVVKNDFPKDAMLVYEVEVTELGKDKATCNFHHCPHIAAFEELGCSKEEIRKLCLDMLIHGDYAAYKDCEELELNFPEIISRDEPVCAYTLIKK